MSRRLQGIVNLPGSKSESNRALMIAAYGNFTPNIDHLSEAHDTVLLRTLLNGMPLQGGMTEQPFLVDCEDAGTVARFLMTYLAGSPGTWFLTGTKRLLERPMAPLVDALCQLGADITFDTSCKAYKINGRPIHGGSVILDASQSSQFASSLLLAAPTWERGLRLSLAGNPTSMPYLEMTIKMMAHFGIQVIREGNTFIVEHQPYQPRPVTVSADWSAASYWYEMLALSDGGSLLLRGLGADSSQGDAVVAEWFKVFGVNTEFVDGGALITLDGMPKHDVGTLSFDFRHNPDLFPSVFVTCISLHFDTVFDGISNLFLKESDRVNGLISELSKIYTFINVLYDDKLIIEKSVIQYNNIYDNGIIFKTYHDHRVAMALAGLMMRFNGLSLDVPDVVRKSYPTFWDDVQKICHT